MSYFRTGHSDEGNRTGLENQESLLGKDPGEPRAQTLRMSA